MCKRASRMSIVKFGKYGVNVLCSYQMKYNSQKNSAKLRRLRAAKIMNGCRLSVLWMRCEVYRLLINVFEEFGMGLHSIRELQFTVKAYRHNKL